MALGLAWSTTLLDLTATSKPFRHPSRHIVGIWAADGVLATWTGRALLDALGRKATGLAVLVVVCD